MSSVVDTLRRLEACPALVKWAESLGDVSPEAAWQACPRGKWLIWLASSAKVDRHLVVRAACACARTALQHVPDGEDRPRIAIETAEAWCRGEATSEQVRVAADTVLAAAKEYLVVYANTIGYYDTIWAYDAIHAAVYAVNAVTDYQDSACCAVSRAEYAAYFDYDIIVADLVRSIIPFTSLPAEVWGAP